MRRSRYRRTTDDRPGLHWTGAAPPVAGGHGHEGAFVTIDGERCYRIAGFDRMPPFLMNVPTDTDLWMFVSSAGGLTAGRRDPDGALFPYENVDQLHDACEHTGPITLLRVTRGARPAVLWEPFARQEPVPSGIERSLAKTVTGHALTFEETARELGLAFRYRWAGSDATGWVRTATLENRGGEPVVIELLDGLRNLLPSGAPLALYQNSSSLVDAYKRADVDAASGLGIFSLTASVSDRPEPAEALRATTVWCHGLERFEVALGAGAIAAFRRGERIAPERVLTGRRGNYLVTTTLTLAPGARAQWHLAADTRRSHVEIAALRARLLRTRDAGEWLARSLAEAAESLRRIVASADGIQVSGREDVAAHHFANVLFNDLRGGVFDHNHLVPGADFARFVHDRDRTLAVRSAGFLAGLPAELEVGALHAACAASGEPDLARLGLEYLPLYFGRRHGDPSRPWNRFSIGVRNGDGSRALRFEGNWRDVFQNWEALARSFPGFLPGVVARFVDASTVDGFNPYRVTRDGFDWEVREHDSPWSSIGYWGDHQVVYLLRLLESLRMHRPGQLEGMLATVTFSYADVPYRLAPYEQIVATPRSTIRYDDERAAAIAAREAHDGPDARLLHDANGRVHHASLLEKLLVPALSKLSSFVPDGGIWMNTERPEWNDANNALVGNGLSVVTLCHLRRYLRCLDALLAAAPAPTAPVATEVVTWLRETAAVLDAHHGALAAERLDERERRAVMDELGRAFERYREPVYARGFGAAEPLALADVRRWCALACEWIERSIRSNRREDGLYHSYNLLEAAPGSGRAGVQRLTVMLEGQVAALSSGLVEPAEAIALLDALFASPLYVAAERSFLLYPERELPAFLDRNVVPDARANTVPLAGALLAAGDTTILERDAFGVLRFHADFHNAHDLGAALDRLAAGLEWTAAVARDRDALAGLFVDVFGHRTFTGRSGRMYAYEGLGCIYWHMVAKLLLAVQELHALAHERGEDAATRDALAAAYYRVRSGLGFEKTPFEFGAFPTDPYSHTPSHAGAQQPGMTGQVKEEILTRLGELGVQIAAGRVRFAPTLLGRDELLGEPQRFEGFDLEGRALTFELPARSLAFTFCAVPVVYTLGAGAGRCRVTWRDGRVAEHADGALDPVTSGALLGRTGEVARIDVELAATSLLAR